MFRKTQVCRAVLLVLSGVGGFAAAPAQAQQQLERVEVTGSSIKRVQVEGPSPVEAYSRKDIERTGATTVNEFLRSIATIDIFDQGEQASNSPAGSGTANIRMRGFDELSVLVLLNGRRLPINALYDSSGAGAAVDVNMIPLSAVERVEILKDGASAIYGADAVAGVVNFITKKDYQGIEARVGFGTSSRGDGTEKKAGFSAGFGNLSTDRYNILVGLDLFKRDPILRKDRSISKSADFTRLGGPDARSSFSPFGNIIDPNTFVPTGATIRPCPADQFSIPRNRCTYDFNASLLTAYNGADRVSGLVLGTTELPSGLRAFGELLVAQEKDHFDAHPVPDIFVASTGDLYFGRFMQGGPRITDRDADLMQLSAGLEGTLQKIEWKVDAGHGRSKVVNNDRNYFDFNLYNDATSAGAIDPTVTTNDQALVDSLKVRPSRVGESTITYSNAKVTGDLIDLSGGSASYALGASVWREKLVDTPDALSQAGEVVGSIQQAAVDTSRKAYAVFAELALPVTRKLEAQLAARYDHYPSYEQTSPKVGVRYLISPALSLRGSYTRSFRAPSLKQLFGGREEGAADFTSDTLCAAFAQPAGCTITGFEVGGSNPNLNPERGTTWNLGLITEPMPGLSATIDWWRVEVRDGIDRPTIDQAVAAGDYGVDAAGRITVTTALKNFAKVKNEGIDLDLQWRLPSVRLGSLTARNSTTYYLHQQRITDTAVGWEEFNGTYAKPRWRNVFSLTLESGPWSGGVALRTTSGFYDTDEPDPDTSSVRKVGTHEEVDLIGSFAGIKNMRLDFGIKNIFDRMPPFSFQNAVSNQYTQLGFAELYTSRGRFLFANLTYQFR